MRMKMKKVLGLSLAVALSLSVLAGCGKDGEKTEASGSASQSAASVEEPSNLNKTGLPLVKEKETLKIVNIIAEVDPPSKDIKVFQEIEAQTNVQVEFEDITVSAWKEKKGLKMASGDLPDVFMGQAAFNDVDLLSYGSQGLFIHIEELAAEYAPNFMSILDKDPELKKQITAVDGHIYGIPNYDNGFVPTTNQVMYINKEWLTKLNLEVPTTYDELYTVLKAFKEKDPNENGKADEIPMTFVKDSYLSSWFASFGVLDSTNPASISAHIAVKDGKVIFTAAQPEYKEAITYFSKLYKEGLIDKEGFTQDSTMFNSKLKAAPERIVGVFESWRSTGWAVAGVKEDDYVAIAPFKGPAGLQVWPDNSAQLGLWNRGSYVITSSCKNPELAMRWGDHMISEEISIQSNLAYKIGEHIEKTADGKYKILRGVDWNKEGERLFAPGAGEVWMMTRDYVSKFIDTPPHMVEKFELDKTYNNYYPAEDQKYPKVFFDVSESEQLAQYKTDIIPFTNGLYAKWIVEGGIDAEWDGYLKKLNEMKLEDMLKIYQTALDRYNSTK